MAVGLKMPVGVNIAGGAQLQEEPFEISKVLRLALSAGDDDNPFQALGISERIIFQANDPSAKALARSNVTAILKKFSDRVALDPSVPIQIDQTKEGELNIRFRYVNLDTNEVNDFNEVLG